jgi:hypothetical protein
MDLANDPEMLRSQLSMACAALESADAARSHALRSVLRLKRQHDEHSETTGTEPAARRATAALTRAGAIHPSQRRPPSPPRGVAPAAALPAAAVAAASAAAASAAARSRSRGPAPRSRVMTNGGSSAEPPPADVDAVNRRISDPRMLRRAIEKFNVSPKGGLRFLGLLSRAVPVERAHPRTVAAVASFLRNTTGLSRARIGEFLSRPSCGRVLAAFTRRVDLDGVDFVEAVERLFAGLSLPGEANPLQRMMEHFAERYFQANPSTWPDADAVHLVAVGTMMLNSSLHNPNVPRGQRMSEKEFVRLFDGARSEGDGVNEETKVPYDFDPAVLRRIYRRVRKRPLEMLHDQVSNASGCSASEAARRQRRQRRSVDSTTGAPRRQTLVRSRTFRGVGQGHACRLLQHTTISGWAQKADSSGYYKRRRFFSVRDGMLMYFKSEPRRDDDDAVPHAAVSLQGVRASQSIDGKQLVLTHGSGGDMLCCKDFSWRPDFIMTFASADEAADWKRAIEAEVTPVGEA